MSKHNLTASALAFCLALIAAVSMAQAGSSTTKLDPNAKILACYKEVTIPAKYDVKKVLVKKAEQKYLRQGNLVYLVEYPAVYREDKTLVEAEHIVMRQVGCKTKK
ncbi:hypothetical protein [Roseovarius pelagicus]|uniref:Uncharacterized protein n=1 Tax=Roseovarius pelagicus TaxID=2980108 RepID=A0ABY6DDV9_9RHOB|nr:hypothetical protein [Roseovarius pelagicus]UXX83730.1 hypothetical protein N7U68_03410 [Roseovarius pelagicus]